MSERRSKLLTPALRARLREFSGRPRKYGHSEYERFREALMDIVKVDRDGVRMVELRPRFPGVDQGKPLGARGDHVAYTKLETLIRTGRVTREEARAFMAEMFGHEYRKQMDYLFDAIEIVTGQRYTRPEED